MVDVVMQRALLRQKRQGVRVLEPLYLQVIKLKRIIFTGNLNILNHQLQMSKETLTESGFEPETSGLRYQRSYQLSYPALCWWSPKLSTVFAQGGVPFRSHTPRNAV